MKIHPQIKTSASSSLSSSSSTVNDQNKLRIHMKKTKPSPLHRKKKKKNPARKNQNPSPNQEKSNKTPSKTKSTPDPFQDSQRKPKPHKNPHSFPSQSIEKRRKGVPGATNIREMERWVFSLFPWFTSWQLRIWARGSGEWRNQDPLEKWVRWRGWFQAENRCPRARAVAGGESDMSGMWISGPARPVRTVPNPLGFEGSTRSGPKTQHPWPVADSAFFSSRFKPLSLGGLVLFCFPYLSSTFKWYI